MLAYIGSIYDWHRITNPRRTAKDTDQSDSAASSRLLEKAVAFFDRPSMNGDFSVSSKLSPFIPSSCCAQAPDRSDDGEFSSSCWDLYLSLQAQIFDPLADDLAEIRSRQTVRDLNGLGAKLGELLVQPVETRADAFVFLKVLAAS
jgi:hypothetical protein